MITLKPLGASTLLPRAYQSTRWLGRLTLACWLAFTAQGPHTAQAQEDAPSFEDPFWLSPAKDAPKKKDALPLNVPLNATPGQAPEMNWYGWKILIANGASLAFLPMIPEFFYLPLATLLFSGPAIHGAHGQTTEMLGSLAINTTLITLGGLIGYYAAEPDQSGEPWAQLGGAVIGGLIGAVGATLIDSFALAHEPVKPAWGSSFSFRLSVGLNGLSVVGQF